MKSMKLKWILVAIATGVLMACGGGGNATTALRWRTDELLDVSTGSVSTFGSVAISADGSGYAVWATTTATTSQVFARRYTGNAWEPTHIVSTAAPGLTLRDVKVAQGANGDVIAVWVEDGTGDRLMSARTVNHTWQGEVVVADVLESRSILPPHLKGNGKGQAVALWTRSKTATADTFDVFSSGFDNGGFLPPVQSNADNINAISLDVAMNATGQAVLAWTEVAGGLGVRLLMQPYKSGVLQSAVALQTPLDVLIGGAQVAVQAGNKASVTWSQQSVADGSLSVGFTTTNDFMQGNWQPSQTLPATGTIDQPPTVALDPQGTSTVVWGEKNGDVRNVMAMRLGAKPLPAQPIVTEDRGDILVPLVASDAGGGALILWTQDIDPVASRSRPFTSRFDPAANAWRPVEAVDTGLPAISNANAHALSVAADGRALAVWTEVTSTERSLAANAFK